MNLDQLAQISLLKEQVDYLSERLEHQATISHTTHTTASDTQSLSTYIDPQILDKVTAHIDNHLNTYKARLAFYEDLLTDHCKYLVSTAFTKLITKAFDKIISQKINKQLATVISSTAFATAMLMSTMIHQEVKKASTSQLPGSPNTPPLLASLVAKMLNLWNHGPDQPRPLS